MIDTESRRLGTEPSTGLLLCALHRHGWWARIWCTREQSIENWGSFGNLSKMFKMSCQILIILEKLMSLGWVWNAFRITSASSFCNLPCKEVYITSIQALQTGVILAKESQQIIFTCQIHGSRCVSFDAVQSCICASVLLCIHFRSCSVSLPTEIYLADTCDTLAYASVAPIQGSRRALRFAKKLSMRIPILKKKLKDVVKRTSNKSQCNPPSDHPAVSSMCQDSIRAYPKSWLSDLGSDFGRIWPFSRSRLPCLCRPGPLKQNWDVLKAWKFAIKNICVCVL